MKNTRDMVGKIKPYDKKGTLTVYLVLRLFVILVMVRTGFRDDWASFFLCILTLVLFLLPSFLSRRLSVDLPEPLEVVVLLFIFCAEILGEIDEFYLKVHHWDTMLHTINGFLCAAVGFAMVDLLNKDEHVSLDLSPFYVAVTAFCFSMTIGTLWEFFEFSGDRLFCLDMQKDTIISSISSVVLNPYGANKAMTISGIRDVVLVLDDGRELLLGVGGYIDTGLIDTMKDLFVNLIGAVAFSFVGFFYIKNRDKKSLASSLIPQVKKDK